MSLLDRLKQLFADAKQVRQETASATSSKPELAKPAAAASSEQANGVSSAQAQAQAERRQKKRINAAPGTRVLIIDDSPTILAMLGRMLRQNEYEVLESEDAERGIEIAHAKLPAIIFLDIVLPGMSGFTALRHLRHDPRTKNIPIIMISGNEQATEQFYVQRIGADDFMKKPFSRAELFTRVEKLLGEDLIPVRFNEYSHQHENIVPKAADSGAKSEQTGLI
jgi:CheY-like chemotaxis protein